MLLVPLLCFDSRLDWVRRFSSSGVDGRGLDCRERETEREIASSGANESPVKGLDFCRLHRIIRNLKWLLQLEALAALAGGLGLTILCASPCHGQCTGSP